MSVEYKKLTFSIHGPHMTQIARDFCYQEKNLIKAFRLLWDITNSDSLSEADHRQLVLDILDGKKTIVGTYPNDDYGIDTDDTKLPGVKSVIEDLQERVIKEHERIHQLLLQRNWLLSCLQESYPISLREFLETYREDFDESMLSPQEANELGIHIAESHVEELSPSLAEYLERQTADYDTDEDYGWLEPNGTFHVAPWGDHYQWAYDYIQDHFATDHVMTPDMARDPGDYLLQKGWVLLHSPSQGIARPSIHPTKRYTKNQQDFLYGYYIDRDKSDLANQIMQNE